MMRALVIISAATIGLALLALRVDGQPTQPADAAPSVFTRIDDLEQRLGALTPEQPMSYFLLGEEVAAEADDAESVDLARTLYVLAYELASRQREAPDIGRSVSLALAPLARTDEEARWLRAMAASLDRRAPLEPDWRPPSPAGSADVAAYKLASALALVRAGEGRRAEVLLAEPGVRELFDRYERLMRSIGVGPAGVLHDMEVWRHCPECYHQGLNQRIVSDAGGTQLCPTCRGNPGPSLSEAELLAQLRFESMLLRGVHRSWSAQLEVDAGAPLRDLDPSELAGVYRIDPDKHLWRDGTWISSPGTRAATEQPATPPTDEPEGDTPDVGEPASDEAPPPSG